jgi:hypothetical protein
MTVSPELHEVQAHSAGLLYFTPLFGEVAQLGERRVRNAEVGSSILLFSTIKTKSHSREWLFFVKHEKIIGREFRQLKSFADTDPLLP